MPTITKESTVEAVAAIVSQALEDAGITATLSGGSAVTIYSINQYQSHDLDFVTAAVIADLKPVLESLGFVHSGAPRLSQFSHPDSDWDIEFPPSPLSFGHLHVNPEACAILELPAGRLRIISPTQSVMDRLAAFYAWKDAQSRDQAVLVAVNQDINWEMLKEWFLNEGESEDEFERFRKSVRQAGKQGKRVQ